MILFFIGANTKITSNNIIIIYFYFQLKKYKNIFNHQIIILRPNSKNCIFNQKIDVVINPTIRHDSILDSRMLKTKTNF